MENSRAGINLLVKFDEVKRFKEQRRPAWDASRGEWRHKKEW